MSDEQIIDRNDPELKYLTVEKNQFNDPATQAEWTQKRLVWVPHESQVRLIIIYHTHVYMREYLNSYLTSKWYAVHTRISLFDDGYEFSVEF